MFPGKHPARHTATCCGFSVSKNNNEKYIIGVGMVAQQAKLLLEHWHWALILVLFLILIVPLPIYLPANTLRRQKKRPKCWGPCHMCGKPEWSSWCSSHLWNESENTKYLSSLSPSLTWTLYCPGFQIKQTDRQRVKYKYDTKVDIWPYWHPTLEHWGLIPAFSYWLQPQSGWVTHVEDLE